MTPLLRKFRDLNLGYTQGLNSLRPPAKAAELSILKDRFGRFLSDELLEFYALADGIDLSDVRIGYFLHPISKILDRERMGEPIRVSGLLDGEILVIGSDGGGGKFAVIPDGLVCHLRNGPVKHGVFDGTSVPVKVIADDFHSFLRRLLADVHAFINDTAGWEYIS